jgi:chemotaxis protein MotB
MMKNCNMSNTISRITLCVLVGLFLSSCVSQKKYNDLLGGKARADHEVSRLTKVEKEHIALQAEMAKVQETLAQTVSARAELQSKYNTLEAAHIDLKKEYDALLENNRRLLASASDEKKDLINQLTLQQQQLDEKARMLRTLEDELAVKGTAIEEREARINALNEQLNAQKNALSNLKDGINNALRGFSATDLTVVERDGKIYVSMSQNLLFAKGSKIIDQKGKDALQKLAGVLKNSPDIDILVEGHTDTDGTADFNWDLSTSRATAVVKELTAHGVAPKQLTAAGRAFYVPVSANDTEEGKSRNRRTEIILAPKLDQLYRLLE